MATKSDFVIKDVIAVLQDVLDRVPDARLRPALQKFVDELKRPDFDRQSLGLAVLIA